jgi:glycosyltransferase involved in cell wall biosynthesis
MMATEPAHTEISASIIIPSYNSHRTISYTIDHILSQNQIQRVADIIVVDSSDDEKTKPYLSSLDNEKITIIHSGIKIIPAIQRNIGVRCAKGNLLIFIDADAFPKENWLSTILSAYDKGRKVGGGGYLVPDFQKNNRIVYAQYYLEFGSFIPTGKERTRKVLPSCNLYCDKTVFQNIGGFPEIRAAEDSLFCREVRKTGLSIVFLPKATVYHIFREDNLDSLKNQCLIGEYAFIFRKNLLHKFYIKGFIFYILVPILLMIKFSFLVYYVLRAGVAHYIPFLQSRKYFIYGLMSWFRGFLRGRKSFSKVPS